jgi:HSP20 family protein
MEWRDMGEDVRRLLDWADEDAPRPSGAGECMPPIDVVETTTGIEILMDLPGVDPGSVQVGFARNTLVIAGRQGPVACEHREAAFHLAERSFGRFVRAVRITGAFDAGAARATLIAGELHLTLPRIEERRGREIRIPVQAN